MITKFAARASQKNVTVAILDDHASIINGYLYEFEHTDHVKVVAAASYGEALEPLLNEHPVDVLLLDINVPTSPTNPNPYPILHIIPQLIDRFPDLAILVITAYNERPLIKAVMDAGANGYILKSDTSAILGLSAIVRSVADGGVYLSEQAHKQLFLRRADTPEPGLTSRQLEALSVCAAYPTDSIERLSKRLGVAHSTARNLLSGAYLRLGVNSRMAAVTKARQLGMIAPPDTSSHARL